MATWSAEARAQLTFAVVGADVAVRDPGVVEVDEDEELEHAASENALVATTTMGTSHCVALEFIRQQ